MKKIILTGGGTAGHVAPNLALVPALKKNGYEIHYIGSHNGIEKNLVTKEGLTYYGISSGKWRRYKSVKNISDIFRIGKGLLDALSLMRKIKPDVVFSKGGFVVVPVIYAAKLCGVKCVIHESDITPGLATKLAIPFAKKVCVSFPETLSKVPKDKGVLTGTPLRESLLTGNINAGISLFENASGNNNPILLVTGGSQGAKAINACVRKSLDVLLKKFRIIHLCGKGNLSGIKQNGYVEFEYLSENMKNAIAASDIVLSRAGANTIFELVALKKPNLLIPLPLEVSRGDQVLNAKSFQQQGFSMVLPENEMTPASLCESLSTLYNKRDELIQNMSSKKFNAYSGVSNIVKILDEQ